MSNTMFEQAIVDAQTLREAALKSAETAVVEKYASEVKHAVDKILEQDDEVGDIQDLGLEDPLAAEEEESTVMGQLPDAHSPDLNDDDVVTIDLDQIIAAAAAEDGEEEFELDAAAVADEVGIELSDDEAAVANRADHDIEISESELVDIFTEMMVVDIGETEEEEAIHLSEVEEEGEELETVVSSSRQDGMSEKSAEQQRRVTHRLDMLATENKELKDLLSRVKDRLQEVNLSNARLLYANRVLEDSSLNEQQKKKIATMVSEARSVDEAKMMYETLQKTLASSPRKTPQSLSEVVSKKSSVILSGRRDPEETTVANPVLNRWATLAGINDK
jgi:hypothetical protein